MGTAIGGPLAATEPRIAAAVFGLYWPDALAEAARQITGLIPEYRPVAYPPGADRAIVRSSPLLARKAISDAERSR